MDSSLLTRYAIPGGQMVIDDIPDTVFLPIEYKLEKHQAMGIISVEEIRDKGLVFIQSVPDRDQSVPDPNTNPKKKKKKIKPCGFYPFNALLNTEDFTHCIGCKGGGCKNLVVRPIDSSKPRACFSNYQVEVCGN